MSERGSFTTEYIYCDECFEKAKQILLGDDKRLCSDVIHGWGSNPYMPIIAGKIGGSYIGEEIDTFELDLNEKLAAAICHPMRIAVLAESCEKFFNIKPNS